MAPLLIREEALRLRRLAQRIIEAVAEPHTERAVDHSGIGPRPIGIGLGPSGRGLRHAGFCRRLLLARPTISGLSLQLLKLGGKPVRFSVQLPAALHASGIHLPVAAPAIDIAREHRELAHLSADAGL